MDNELFNDVPDTWDADATAFYRSKSGNWFKFRKNAAGKYEYVEKLPSGSEVVRLTKQ